ncbi:MAG: DNA-directed RNA polymerase subunit beta [Clostridia bacterium]|nr:DNA-directed RNA polymerase subunit beta [Clostridia bacterium]MBR2448550.1 DNA-directed RNA polymerase subunit beta [Clostridia bacterium]
MTRVLPEIVSGKVTRKTFSKIKEAIELPYLVKIQKDSYDAFIKEGIGEVLEDFSPITDYSDHFEMYFLDYSLEGKPKYDEKECRDRDATYALPLRVKVRLVNKVTDEVIDQEVFMGDFPLMTDNGSFIINGAERVIVSQLVRSPGVYNGSEMDKSGKKLFNTTVIPSRGAWLEFEQDSQNVLWVRVDRTRKLTATVLLRALGFGSDDELINNLFTGNKMIADTAEKDTSKSESDSLIELYRRLRPGEIPTDEAVKQHLKNLFFDPRRYDLARVGRYKFNKRLRLGVRIVGLKSFETVVSPDGEVLAEAGSVITKTQAEAIQNAGINYFYADVNGEKHKIIANNVVSFEELTGINPRVFGLLDYVYYPTLTFAKTVCDVAKENGAEETAEILKKEINALFYIEERKIKPGEEKPEDRKLEEKARETRIKFINACVKYCELTENGAVETVSAEDKKVLRPLMEKLNHKHITVDDIVASVSVNLDLAFGINTVDNIDHLGNRRVRSVGELLQNQFRIGIARLERVIRERMGTQDPKEVSPQGLINVRPVSSAIKEFFGSSQLSQFMDQTNPIAELTHKRKLSALGPGGLNRDRATFEVRDVHHSHYGRMCPIETPEGQNIGLISSLAAYAKVNEFGFIESPYRKVEHKMDAEGKIVTEVTEHVDYLTADEEDNYIVAQANEPLVDNKYFVNDRVSCRHRDEITEDVKEKMDYMDVSPKQLISVATALIPFLENDDTNRALMGSNMQRQAVPLLCPENAIVATGIERRIAYDSGVMINAVEAGVVKSVASDLIVIKEDDGNERQYILKKFERSNQGTCLNQRPIVDKGERIEKGQTIADGPSTKNGELALGRNILVGFMSWEGYNYEDAILLSEKLVREDVFTTIHIEEHEIEARDTRLGEEEITRDIPNVGEDALKDLDEDGIVRIGAEVNSGDILVGKVTPKGETELTPEERLLRAIFGEKSREVRDTSLKVPHGEGGIVVDVKIFTRANKDELAPGVNKLVRVYIAQKRKISIGDKMAGRHGNKGVISRILPESDMPFMADGTPLQIVLNPLGVPSRMNIGQVLEVHLGLVCKQLGWKIATPVFDGATEGDIKELLRENNIVNPDGEVDGKIQLYDGRTGEPFENRVTVGQMYMIKLIHLVDDKIHARSTGPYSLVTQQPLGGKAQFGGQRFGEMEIWALEAYGAAHILQEILTVKSDDIVGRVKTYESIVKGTNISEPGIPEAFKVLLKELQSLALDMKVLTENKEELAIKDLIESDIDDIPYVREKVIQDEVSIDDIDESDVGEMVFEDSDTDDDLGDEINYSNMFDDDDDEIDTTIPDEMDLEDDDFEEFDVDDEE